MIIEAGKTPGWRYAMITDTDTGEPISEVLRLDSETGLIVRYPPLESGRLLTTPDGEHFATIEERRNFRVVHRATGIIMCQHPQP